MLTAIFIIVIMGSISIFVMTLSGKSVKETTAQFQSQQAELYAKSYTEYAILAVTGHSRAVNCIQRIDGTIGTPNTGNGYNIRTHIAYIGPASIIGTCPANRQLSTNVQTPQTQLSIIIDAYVDYKDPDNSAGPWFTVHRRSIQKI